MSGRKRIVTAALIAVFAGPGASAGADSSSLYRGPAPRPGPDILYEPVAHATAFRVTLNTLKDVNRVAFTIALGSSSAPVAFPYGANVKALAAYFLTVHGGEVDLRHAATGRPVTPAPTVSVNVYRRQFEV